MESLSILVISRSFQVDSYLDLGSFGSFSNIYVPFYFWNKLTQ